MTNHRAAALAAHINRWADIADDFRRAHDTQGRVLAEAMMGPIRAIRCPNCNRPAPSAMECDRCNPETT